MRNCKTRLGNYLWNERSNLGLKRTSLAKLIDCKRESITVIEQTGDDDEGILPKLIEVLELDKAVVEKRKKEDKEHRLAWLEYCGGKQRPTIFPARTTQCPPVRVPKVVVDIGNDAVEEFARDFARHWNQTIELFVRNHIRFVISPTGEMDINELGFGGEPWLDEMVEL